MSEEKIKGYQFEWFRYDWEGGELNKKTSEWEMHPLVYASKQQCRIAANDKAKEDHTQVRVVYFDGEDWHYQDRPLAEPDFEEEMKYFGSWTKNGELAI